MSEVANELTRASQASQLSADAASLLDGYDPNTGDPIVIQADRPASYLTNVGDRQVVYTGDPNKKPEQATTSQVDTALKDLFSGDISPVAAVAKDVGMGALETPAAILNGMANAGNELVDAIDALGDWGTQTMGGPAYVPGQGMTWQAPGEWNTTQAAVTEAGGSTDIAGGNRLMPGAAPDSTTGKIVEGVSQFLTGFMAGGSALRTLGVAKVGGAAVQAAAKGAISDFAFFDGQSENLSKIIQGTPLANPVTEFLATDQETPEITGRLKHAAEGLGLGTLTEGLIYGLRALRAARKARPATVPPVDPEEAVAAASESQYRQIVGDPAGDIFTTREGEKLAQAEADLNTAGGATGTPRLGTAPERVGLNMARVNTPDDVAEVLTRTEDMNQDALARSVGYRSWAEADAAAGGLDGYRLLMERDSGRVFTDAEALAARKTDLAAWAAVREAATAHQAGATPATAAAVREAWVKAFAIHKELLGARADAARALAVWRMTAEQGNAKATFRAMDAAFGSGGKATADEIAKRVLTLDVVTDPETAARFLEKSGLARTADMVAEYWQGSMLSSPKTQLVNMLGNSANILWSMMERAAAGKLSHLIGNEDGIDLAEAGAMSFGAREGMRDAFRYTYKMLAASARQATGSVLRNTDQIEKALSEKQALRSELDAMRGRQDEQYAPAITAANARGVIPGSELPVISHAINGLGAFMRSFGNAMAFQDDLFKLVNHRAELYAQAARKAGAELREGDITKAEMGQRIADLITNPTEEMTLAARNAAEERTFTAPPGEAARIALNARRVLNKAGMGVPLGSMILPFVNTPANILGYAFRRTPLAPLFKKYRDAFAAGGAEADLANAQVAMGTMTMALMADYAMSGLVTGAYPEEATQRAIWQRDGIQPYSIKVGDKWVGYNRLDPVGAIAGFGADLGQLMFETPFESDDDRQNEIDEAWVAAIGAAGSMVLNKTYLTTISGLNEFLTDPGRYGDSFAASFLSPIVPNVVRDVAKLKDPYLREASNIIDRLRSRIPGQSEQLPQKLDLWGNPMEHASNMGAVYDMFSPVPIRTMNAMPIDDELVRLKADISPQEPSISVDGVDVSLRNRKDIYEELVKTSAQEVRLPQYYNMTMPEYLNALVTDKIPDSDLYKDRLDSRGVTQRDDDEKIDMIRAVMKDYRAAARDQVKEKYARDLQEMADRKRRTMATEQQ